MATTNKRRSYDGYSIENLPAQVDLINRHAPKGQWRRAELPEWGWGILTQGGVGNTGWGKFL